MFRNKIRFNREELLAPCPSPKLENHPLSAVCDCLFNMFTATLHIGGRSSVRNMRTRHAVVTRTHLSHGLGNSLVLNLSSAISCHRGSPRPRMMLAERHGSPNSHQMDAHHELHHHASAATTGSNADDNLHTFREALAFSSESLLGTSVCFLILSIHLPGSCYFCWKLCKPNCKPKCMPHFLCIG